MKLREEEFYEQYHQHGGTTIIPTEIFNELYDDATEEIERLNNIIKEVREIFKDYGEKEDIVGYTMYNITGEMLLKLLEILDKANKEE